MMPAGSLELYAGLQAYKGHVGWGNNEGVRTQELWISAICACAVWWGWQICP
jgi:hypothetical protein